MVASALLRQQCIEWAGYLLPVDLANFWYFPQISTEAESDGIPAALEVGSVSLAQSCKSKFFSAASLPSDPQEMRTYIVLLRRYSTSRAALRMAATLENLARKKQASGVRVGELSLMYSGQPSLIVETTVAGLRVVSPACSPLVCCKVCVCPWGSADMRTYLHCSAVRGLHSLKYAIPSFPHHNAYGVHPIPAVYADMDNIVIVRLIMLHSARHHCIFDICFERSGFFTIRV